MELKNRNLLLTLSVGAMVFIADQLTKWLTIEMLPKNHAYAVIDGFFNFVHVQNRGAAFGFLNRSDIDWQVWFFGAATLAAVGVILYLVKHCPQNKRLLPIALGAVLGGALGNMSDRIRFRSVTDFLDFYWGNYHWPAFNLADTAICCGAVLAGFLLWKMPDEMKR